MVKTKRFSVWGVSLDPTQGSEQGGYRPVLIISPDKMNKQLKTVIVAPMTTKIRGWPTRVEIHHSGKEGEVALDQIRTLDKTRLRKAMGTLDQKYHSSVLDVLAEIFAE